MQSQRPRDSAARHGLAGLDEVVIGRASAPRHARQSDGTRRLVLEFPDETMSSKHARLVQAFGRWMIEDCGSRNGTFVDGRRIERAPLRDGARIEVGQTLMLYRDAVPTATEDPSDHLMRGRPPPAGLETLLPPLGREFAKLARIAASEVPVLLQGETGVGKEVLARAVHRLSGRSGQFVAVNCGALPPGLIESELFGHRKGAFTGATEDRLGLVRAADGGTLFLDEVGDLAFPSQAALLRVLQEREVRSVGATRSVPVDLRIVAATHKDLPQQVELGSFRADLYGRLMGFTLRLPALRERREDLGIIVGRLLDRIAPGAPHLSFGIEAARAFFAYDWPLNVREVEQALMAASVLAEGGSIELEHLPPALRASSGQVPAEPPSASARVPERSREDDALRERLIASLEQHGGNISAVAREFGKARVQIQRWVKRLDIDVERFRSGGS